MAFHAPAPEGYASATVQPREAVWNGATHCFVLPYDAVRVAPSPRETLLEFFESTYALACFHEENKNGKLDTGLFGIPSEGTVASNQAKGFMGPPSFKDAKFAFSGGSTELRLRMGY